MCVEILIQTLRLKNNFIKMWKEYDVKMTKYLKTLESIPENMISLETKEKTIKSILNYKAVFLDTVCENCPVKLVDTIGLQHKKPVRHAMCGNCGYSGVVSSFTQVII